VVVLPVAVAHDVALLVLLRFLGQHVLLELLRRVVALAACVCHPEKELIN
jgi:hypothetical protein